MKNIVLILSTILMMGCDAGKKQFTKYQIINDSDYSIEIIIYQTWISRINSKNKIMLSENGEFWESDKFQSSEPGGDFYPAASDFFIDGDSVIINFDAQRFLIHKFVTFSNANGILSQEKYQKIIDGNLTILRYTFTNEDYNNAEEIGGG